MRYVNIVQQLFKGIQQDLLKNRINLPNNTL